MYTFQKFPAQFWVYPLTGYILYKNQAFLLFASVRKEDLKIRIFLPKNSQLCCVMVTKHIFAVLYMHFISHFYMVIIHLYVVLFSMQLLAVFNT